MTKEVNRQTRQQKDMQTAISITYHPNENFSSKNEKEGRKRTVLTEDLINGWEIDKIQDTIQELVATKLSQREAKVLQALRRREEDLKAKELLETAAIAARDSDSDTETIHGNDQHTTPQERILQPPKPSKSQDLTLGCLKQINLKHANIQPIQPYRGKGDEDWPKFKNKLITHFNTMELDDEQAASQFCAYVEDNAYRVWESLSDATKKSLPETLRAFDRHYDDVQKHGYWQITYENLTYPGTNKRKSRRPRHPHHRMRQPSLPRLHEEGQNIFPTRNSEGLHPEKVLGAHATQHPAGTFHPLRKK